MTIRGSILHLSFVCFLSMQTLYCKENPNSCYSVQLISSKNVIYNSKHFPKGSKIMHIGGVYTVRNGCYNKIDELKKDFSRLSNGFSNALIVSTYRFRFKDKNQHKNKLKSKDDVFHYPWENIKISSIKKDIKAKEKNIFTNINPILYKNKKMVKVQTENKVALDEYRLYIYPFASIYYGQKALDGLRLKSYTQKLEVGLQYRYFFNKYWKVYADFRLIPYRTKKNSYTKNQIVFDVKELYCISDRLFDNQLNFLFGRKLLKDNRSWYYNTYLDTVGIFNKHDLLSYEIYGGTRLDSSVIIDGTSSNKHNLKNIKFLIAHIGYNYFVKNSIEFFSIYENSKTIEDRELKWIGLRADGDITDIGLSLNYWIDISGVTGNYIKNEVKQNINGIGFDVGIQYNLRNSKDSITLSFAHGSRNYTQPYLTNNRSDYLSKHLLFRYYGSFFKPELTNINITSFYYSHKISTVTPTTIIVAFHNYRQVEASSVDYSVSSYVVLPNGIDRDLGNELDIILGQNHTDRYNWRLVLAYFLGGNSFSSVALEKDGVYGQLNFRYYW